MIQEAAEQGADGNNVEAALSLTNRILPLETQWRAQLQSLQKAIAADSAAAAASAKRGRADADGHPAGLRAARPSPSARWWAGA